MVFGLFSKEGALKRNMEKTVAKHAQSVDRRGAMEKLLKDGSEEALFGLCRRFSFVYDKGIEDQQEKEWVVQALTERPDAALEPLHRYMKQAGGLGYPLRILERIGDEPTIWKIIDDLLADEAPGYTRDPKKRIDIIEWLAEWDVPSPQDTLKRVQPYLADYDENVRFKSIEACSLRPCPEMAEPLLETLLREDEESARIKKRAAEVLAEQETPVGSRKKEVAALLDGVLSEFKLHRDRLTFKSKG